MVGSDELLQAQHASPCCSKEPATPVFTGSLELGEIRLQLCSGQLSENPNAGHPMYIQHFISQPICFRKMFTFVLLSTY